jgi:hypothetical protein
MNANFIVITQSLPNEFELEKLPTEGAQHFLHPGTAGENNPFMFVPRGEIACRAMTKPRCF